MSLHRLVGEPYKFEVHASRAIFKIEHNSQPLVLNQTTVSGVRYAYIAEFPAKTIKNSFRSSKIDACSAATCAFLAHFHLFPVVVFFVPVALIIDESKDIASLSAPLHFRESRKTWMEQVDESTAEVNLRIRSS